MTTLIQAIFWLIAAILPIAAAYQLWPRIISLLTVVDSEPEAMEPVIDEGPTDYEAFEAAFMLSNYFSSIGMKNESKYVARCLPKIMERVE